MFLRNAWYVAARDEDVTRNLLGTVILGDRVVLYRATSGEPVALEDACVHRKLPLSMGRLQGDEVQCGYHGMVFDSSGQCIRVPGATRIPTGAQVRKYPVVSRYGLVWVWMGDPARAQSSDIISVAHADDPAWGRGHSGTMTVDSNYLYVVDNLLDPSHVAWVHRSSFGNEACEEVPVRATASPDGVIAARWMYDVDVAPFYAPLVSFTGRCDRLQHYEVRFPSHAIIRAVFAPAGSGGIDKPLSPDAMLMDSYNFLTPIDAAHTRYFWFQMRNFEPDNSEVTRSMDEAVAAAFEEDRPILAAVHRGFENRVTPNVDLATDRAPALFRQRLAQLIATETQASVAPVRAHRP
jgi:phenylpropionate dioxygenase-like ring-hydroxylating dioxygenase large terminal subunit